MAIAHTLHKMQELTLLLLTLTLAKNAFMNSFKTNGELGIGTWKLCSATLKEKFGRTLMYMYKSCLAKAFQWLSTQEMFFRGASAEFYCHKIAEKLSLK